MKSIFKSLGMAALLVTNLPIITARAQNPNSPAGATQSGNSIAQVSPQLRSSRPQGDSDISADKLEYLDKKIICVGNVSIRRGTQTITGDYVTYDTVTDIATARGNVHFDDSVTGQTWDGDEAWYNFREKTGSFGTSKIYSAPFTVESESSRQLDDGLQELDNVMVTTCIPEDPEFRIHASKAMVFDETIVRGRNVVFWLNGLPILYLPRYTVDLERDTTRFDVLPGYSSRQGAYLLTAYGIPINENLLSVSHLDYRANRGIGFGQDFKWSADEESADFWRGAIRGYYTDDDMPYKSMEQEERQRADGLDIDPERYRLRFTHIQTVAERDLIYAEMGKLSDPEVVLDFFDEEYRAMPQPENRISYIHYDDAFSAGLDLHKNLNEEFFSGVNRLPEAYLNVPRLRIMESPFYYEGFHSAGQLEATFSDSDKERFGRVGYDTQRVHTENTVLFPTRHFGWLNVIPRIGYTGTFYGDTFESIETTDGTNVVDGVNSLGADARNLVEIGVESSFKAFKVLHNEPIAQGVGMRHVVEPFVNYTLIPEQDLRPVNIYQFDRIDQLDHRNDVRFGLRNKWQTKRPVSRPSPTNPARMESYNQIVDLVDVAVSTAYLLDAEDDEESLGTVFFDGEFRPADWMVFDVRAQYDNGAGEFSRVNSQLQFYGEDRSYVAFDHYYRPDQNHVIQSEYSLWPQNTIGLEGYTRYEILQGEFEEQTLLATYKTDCVGYGIGVRWIAGEVIEQDDTVEDEDEWQAWFQIWLTAFPNGLLELGR